MIKIMTNIAVLTNGFVYVGKIEEINGETLIIHQAHNIRQWGTTRGLGEIALNGPTEKTILDFTGVVRAPYHSLIFLIDCEEKPWRRFFD